MDESDRTPKNLAATAFFQMTGVGVSSEEYLSVLNPEQKEAVKHSGSPLLILAGAGSGKTRVITTKIAYMIDELGILPWHILAVTFTKKAAAEMAERAKHLSPNAVKSHIRTFHSFGSWFLRLYSSNAGIDPNFTVYDDDDMVTLLLKAVPSLNRQQASFIAHKISLAKDYCLTPDSSELSTIESSPEFPVYYAAYEKKLRQTGNVDFGDLIMLPVLMMEADESVRTDMHSRFQVVLVDEYQDSNVAQFKLLQQLVGEKTYVCVVGDDDQSIYKFRGAEVQNILTFHECFPNTKIIKLERNYRSVSPVLTVANDMISNNTQRLGKELVAVREKGKKPTVIFLPAQKDETKLCADMIEKAHKGGCPYSDWAILYRTNAQSLGFETEFLHAKIPYTVVGSLKFYQREEIKDLLSILAFVVNQKDEIAFRRIINKPARGVGGVTQDKVVLNAPNHDLLEGCRLFSSSMSKKAKTGVLEFVAFIDGLISDIDVESSEPGKLSELVDIIIKKSGLGEYHSNQDEIAGTQRLANMQELVNSAVLYNKNRSGLLEFLDHIELDRTLELQNQEDNQDAVTLITLHNTKGLEFPRVIITGLEDGIFPRKDKTEEELEEERRLFYVGITRAKDELYLTSCGLRQLYGRTEYMKVSPFLLELDPKHIDVVGKPPLEFKTLCSDTQEPNTQQGRLASFMENHPELAELADKWKKGRKVYHDDWGYGLIVQTNLDDNCSDYDDEYVINIQFESGSLKKIMPKYQSHSLMLIKD